MSSSIAETAEGMRGDIARLQKSMESALEERKQMEAEIKELRETVVRLDRERAELSHRNKELDYELTKTLRDKTYLSEGWDTSVAKRLQIEEENSSLRTEIERCKAENKELRETIASAESERAKLQQRNEELASELSGALHDKAYFSDGYSKLFAKFNESEKRRLQLEVENSSVREEIECCRNKIEIIGTERALFQQRNEELHHEVASESKQSEACNLALREKLEQVENERLRLEAKNRELRDEAEKERLGLEAENRGLRGITEKYSQLVTERSKLAEAEVELANLRKELGEYEEKYSRLETENKELRTKCERLTSLYNKIRESEIVHEENMQRMMRGTEMLKGMTATNNQLKKDNKELRKKVKELTKVLDSITEERDRYYEEKYELLARSKREGWRHNELHQKVERLTKALDGVEEEKKKLHDENKELNDILEHMERNRDKDLRELRKSFDDTLRSERGGLDEENAFLYRVLSKCKNAREVQQMLKENDSLREKISALEAELRCNREELVAERAKACDGWAKLSNLETIKREAVEQLESVRAELKYCLGRIEQQNKEISRYVAELRRTKEEIATEREVCDGCETTISDLQTQLRDALTSKQEVRAHLEDTRAELERCRKQIEQQGTEISRYVSEAWRSSARIQELEDQLSETKNNLNTVRKQIEVEGVEFHALQKRHLALRREEDSLIERVEYLEHQLCQTEDELNKARKATEEKEMQLDALNTVFDSHQKASTDRHRSTLTIIEERDCDIRELEEELFYMQLRLRTAEENDWELA